MPDAPVPAWAERAAEKVIGIYGSQIRAIDPDVAARIIASEGPDVGELVEAACDVLGTLNTALASGELVEAQARRKGNRLFAALAPLLPALASYREGESR